MKTFISSVHSAQNNAKEIYLAFDSFSLPHEKCKFCWQFGGIAKTREAPKKILDQRNL